MKKPEVVVIGASAGGLSVLERILSSLNPSVFTPILICQHLGPESGDSIMKLLRKHSSIPLKEPEDKELIVGNRVYIAPADYHMVVERDRTISVTLGPKVNYCRPSIDVLFETAAEAYLSRVLGIILTGANCDGTEGFRKIKSFGGMTIAQDPIEADVEYMPECAIKQGLVDRVLGIEDIIKLLNSLLMEESI